MKNELPLSLNLVVDIKLVAKLCFKNFRLFYIPWLSFGSFNSNYYSVNLQVR